MTRPKKTKKATTQSGWDTAAARIRWLLENYWQNNRLAMSREIGVSHTAINKIANQQREPGRRVLELIAAHPKVNPAWVLSGEGEPFLEPPSGGAGAVPVARVPLPGAPQQHAKMLTGDTLDISQRCTRSTYWLRLCKDEPILKDQRRGFHQGDMLLMETDRREFPAEPNFFGELCVVKNPTGKKPPFCLACVEYHHEDCSLRADIFQALEHVQIEEIGVIKYPGRPLKAFSRNFQIKEIGMSSDPDSDRVDYGDIVAVWTNVLVRSLW
jgi:hypothetical protein